MQQHQSPAASSRSSQSVRTSHAAAGAGDDDEDANDEEEQSTDADNVGAERKGDESSEDEGNVDALINRQRQENNTSTPMQTPAKEKEARRATASSLQPPHFPCQEGVCVFWFW